MNETSYPIVLQCLKCNRMAVVVTKCPYCGDSAVEYLEDMTALARAREALGKMLVDLDKKAKKKVKKV